MAILKIKEKSLTSLALQEYEELAPFVPARLTSPAQLSETEIAAIAMALHIMLPKDHSKSSSATSNAWKISALQGSLR